MDKRLIIVEISKRTKIRQVYVMRLLSALHETVKDALMQDEKVKITGLGSFITVRQQAKQGRHMRTGARVAIPARRKAKFKPGVDLIAAINGGK
jgi:DNA-binding protein HU-beta